MTNKAKVYTIMANQHTKIASEITINPDGTTSNSHQQSNGSVGQIRASSKGEIFRILNAQLPQNDMSVPDYIYRADLIPLDLIQLPTNHRVSILESAAIPLSFEHGYPAINESTPFWEQLPYEPHNAYQAFVVFLEMPQKSQAANPVRMLPMIAELTNIPLEDVAAYSHMYYWYARSRAYDLFIVACHHKQREQRIMSIEGAHFTMAEKQLEKIQKLTDAKLDRTLLSLSDPESGELDDVKLKDLVDMVQKLVQIQRVSVGLPAHGSSTYVQQENPHASIQDTYKDISQNANPTTNSDGKRSADMDALLENPEDLALIQNLVVRMQNATRTN